MIRRSASPILIPEGRTHAQRPPGFDPNACRLRREYVLHEPDRPHLGHRVQSGDEVHLRRAVAEHGPPLIEVVIPNVNAPRPATSHAARAAGARVASPADSG